MTPIPPAAGHHGGDVDATPRRPDPHRAATLSGAAFRLLVALSVAGLAACGGSRPTQKLSESTVPPTAAPEAPKIGARGFCGDGTASVNPAALEAAVVSLAATVEGWVPPKGNHMAGTPPVPALSLKVRKVRSGSSVALEGQVAVVEIPAVPGVIPSPAVTDPGYVDLDAAFQRQSRAFDLAVGAGGSARTKADTGAALIRQTDWAAPQSEIAGCLEGLARSTEGPDRRFVAVTDLDQNQAPQQGNADFTGVSILIFHVGTDLVLMKSQEDAFAAQWRTQGAAVIQFRPPETISQLLPAWLRTGRVT